MKVDERPVKITDHIQTLGCSHNFSVATGQGNREKAVNLANWEKAGNYYKRQQ